MKKKKKDDLCHRYEPVVITLDQSICDTRTLASKLFKDADGKPFSLDRVDIASVKNMTAKLTISYETKKSNDAELMEKVIIINRPEPKSDVELINDVESKVDGNMKQEKKGEKKYVLCVKQGHEPSVIILDQPICNAEILASKLFKDADGKPFNLHRVDIASVKSMTAKLTISYETEKFDNVELVEEKIIINMPQSKVDVEPKGDVEPKTTMVSSSKIQIFEDEIVGESVSSIKRKAEDILDENASKLEMLSFDEHTEIILKGASTYKMKWTATKFSKGNGYFRGWSFGENDKKPKVEPRWKASIWPILAIIALGIISLFTFSGRGSYSTIIFATFFVGFVFSSISAICRAIFSDLAKRKSFVWYYLIVLEIPVISSAVLSIYNMNKNNTLSEIDLTWGAISVILFLYFMIKFSFAVSTDLAKLEANLEKF